MILVQQGYICHRPTGEVLHVDISTWDVPCGGGWVQLAHEADSNKHTKHLPSVEQILHSQRSSASLSLKSKLCIEYLVEFGIVHVHNPNAQ
jgi:hypothetical protein